MKQIILGCFGMILMFGLFFSEWSIYHIAMHKEWEQQSVRAVERLLRQKEAFVEESELLQMVDMELEARSLKEY